MKLKNVKVGQRVQIKDITKPATHVISCEVYGLKPDHAGTIIRGTLSPLGNVYVQFDEHYNDRGDTPYLIVTPKNLRKVK